MGIARRLPSSPLQQGRLALLAAAIFWSLGGVFIKQIPAGPLAITFYRSLFAAIALLITGAITPSSSSSSAARIPPARELAVSALLFTALLSAFVAATQITTAANAIILQYTAPIYVIALSALLLREPPRRADLAALALCM